MSRQSECSRIYK